VSEGRLATRWENWVRILQTQNLPAGRELDPVSRWLLITRASVLSMTVVSALIGGLLSVGQNRADWGLFALSMLGLVVAHSANNMINDYFDLAGGVDTEGYVRTEYAPHPILSGLISKEGLLASIALLNAIDLAVLAVITHSRGFAAVGLALAGLFISVFYVAPPLRLKHRGLGEPCVAIVWGPLMIGGTYFVTTGELPPWVLLASVPYALLVTAVLFGKHVDKIAADTAKGIRTLPVILGECRALAATRVMLVAFYFAIGGLVAAGVLGVWTLLVVAGIPRLVGTLRVFRNPRPQSPPEGYPIWPLWYVAWAFLHTRRAGALLISGMALNALFPWYL
jgi:1,4-dihydroxy-2-naphthoate octaprenyltransferase